MKYLSDKSGKQKTEQTHFDVCKKVRRAIVEFGGSMPESGNYPEIPDCSDRRCSGNQVANLLSRVVLFRAVLAKTSALDDTVLGSGQDDAAAIAYRALRG
ncbi:MAG: hypothetical protein Q7U12_16450 [Undibacterium sp.]|jgi:hypothetical protein|nr:hypothetical protein [Undibacterium sp.]